MRKIKKVFPHTYAGLIGIIVSAIIITVLSLKHLSPSHPLAVLSYLYSVYGLISAIILTKRISAYIKAMSREDILPLPPFLIKIMRKNRYTMRYIEDAELRAEISLYLGLAINLVFVIFKTATGIYYRSAWSVSVAVYYLVFGSIRFMLMRNYRKNKAECCKLHGYKTARLCGVMMLFLNLAVAGMSYYIIWQNKSSDYAAPVAIISAVYTFYYVITAIAGAVSFRKRDNAILAATKNLNVSAAALSVLTLQTMMIHTFGSNGDYIRRMNMITGSVVFVILIANAISVIVSSQRNISKESEV